jgi:hypothetical protein
MLGYEIERLVPFSSGELIFDHHVLATDEKGCSKVGVVLVQKQRIERYLNICRACGFEISNFQVRIAALANLISFRNATLYDKESEMANYTILSVEKGLLEIGRIENNALVFSRGIELPEGDRNALISEAEKTEELHKREFNEPLFQNTIIAGDSSVFSGMEERFDIKSEISPSEVFETETSRIGCDSPFALSLGLALNDHPTSRIKFDLLPTELREKKSRKKLLKWLASALGLFAVVVILAYSNVYALFLVKKNRIEHLQKQISALKPLGDEIKKMRDKVIVVQKQMDTRNSPLQILSEIVQTTPADISLNSFHLDFSGRLTITGEATEFSKPYSYVSLIEDSERFEDVSAQYVTRKRVGDQETVIFKIACDVVNFEEE